MSKNTPPTGVDLTVVFANGDVLHSCVYQADGTLWVPILNSYLPGPVIKAFWRSSEQTDINALASAALKATAGPWARLNQDNYVYALDFHSDGEDSWQPVIAKTDSGEPVDFNANAAYIAAADPSTVLKLIYEVTRLRAQMQAASRSNLSSQAKDAI